MRSEATSRKQPRSDQLLDLHPSASNRHLLPEWPAGAGCVSFRSDNSYYTAQGITIQKMPGLGNHLRAQSIPPEQALYRVEQHQLLENVLAICLDALSQYYPSPAQMCGLMLSFAHIVGQTSVIQPQREWNQLHGQSKSLLKECLLDFVFYPGLKLEASLKAVADRAQADYEAIRKKLRAGDHPDADWDGELTGDEEEGQPALLR